MAEYNNSPFLHPMPIISPQFCVPHLVDLKIVRKLWSDDVVTDANGNLLFKVKSPHLSLSSKLVLLDNAGHRVVTLEEKVLSFHGRWEVFRGDSTDSKDLLFRVKNSSVIQLNTKLDIFLATNISEEVCDFKVKGSWSGRSYHVYTGDSSNMVAHIHENFSLLGKGKMVVTVQQNVDHAFIIALVAILDKKRSEKRRHGGGGGHRAGGGAAATLG